MALKNMPPNLEVSIVLPAYNEAVRIETCVDKVEEAVKSFSHSYEIIVTEDGSSDGTDLIVKRLSETNRHLTFLHSSSRLGKGGAIKKALKSSMGAIVVFMDVDLATSLRCLFPLVKLVEERKGLVIGSRLVKGSKVERPVSRTLSSLVYNVFVRALFLDGVRDHQCGFKAMSRQVAEVVVKTVESDGWFFDTELILACKRLGYPVTEFGVEWTEPRAKAESKVRIFDDASKIGKDLLRFRLKAVSG